MSKQKVITENRYDVHMLKNGFCYATHSNCSWNDVKRFKSLAKTLGETIKTEKTHTVSFEYQ